MPATIDPEIIEKIQDLRKSLHHHNHRYYVLDDPEISLSDIFQGAFPFVLIMLAVTILLVLVPELSLVFV